MEVLWIIFFVFFPVVVIYLCQRFPLLNRIGAIVICYAVGILIGNMGILPADIASIQDLVITLTIPIAIPLIFFSLDMKGWLRLAPRTLLAFFLQVVSVLFVSAAGFFLFSHLVGEETWKVSGMLVGVYTGGTVNLAAIGAALAVNPTVYITAHTADIAVSALYLFLVISVLQRIYLTFLPPFQAGKAGGETTTEDLDSYAGFFARANRLPLLGAFGLAVAIFALGAALTLVVPKERALLTAILTVTTLGILCSLSPRIRRIPKTFQLGQYLILIFCLAVSSMSEVHKLFTTAPAMIGLVAFVVFGCVIVHAALAALFRIDADTVIITSIAGIFSPPFVPMVAVALKNKEIVPSGVITGIIGWVAGTYLGIALAYFLKNY